MEGKKRLKNLIKYLKSKKRFFLICTSATLIVGASLIIILLHNKTTKIAGEVRYPNPNTCEVFGRVFVGSNQDWCKDKNVILKDNTKAGYNEQTRVFMTGEHKFNSLTLENNTKLGTVDIYNNIAVKEHGFLELPNIPPTLCDPDRDRRCDPRYPSKWYLDINVVRGKRAQLLKLKKLNPDGNWNTYTANTQGEIRVYPLDPGLYEIEFQYLVDTWYTDPNLYYGIYKMEIYSIRDRYGNRNYLNNNIFFLSRDKSATVCGISSSAVNGLCGEFSIWSNFNNIVQTKKISAPLNSFDNLDFRQRDPFTRSQDFAYLKLNISGDLNNNGTIEVAGGKNGGPYLSDRNSTSFPDYSSWLSNGKLQITATNIYNNGGLIQVNGSDGVYSRTSESVKNISDGGYGGIILLEATNKVTIRNSITANGGNGQSPPAGDKGSTIGGGGGGGIVIINANTSDGVYGIQANGGAGGQGSMGRQLSNAGRSLLSPVEASFSEGKSLVSNPSECTSNNCHRKVRQTECGQRGGWRGEYDSSPGGGILAGDGGESNCGLYEHAPGGGGGAGGIIIINVNNLLGHDYINADGGSGGNGYGYWENRCGGKASRGGSGGIASQKSIPSYTGLGDVVSLIHSVVNDLNIAGTCGSFGEHSNGAGGGGGAGGVVNIISNYLPSAPASRIEGDIYAGKDITVEANATGIVTSGGTIQNIISDISANLKGYTINSATNANWSEARKINLQVINRLKNERAKSWSVLQSQGYNLNFNPSNLDPEGGVWIYNGNLNIDGQPIHGRGTIIVSGSLSINSDFTPADAVGFIVEGGDVTIGPNAKLVNAAIFAPNSNIIIAGNSSSPNMIRGLLVAKNIYIRRGGIIIAYNPQIIGTNTSALPGFSEILAPTWREEAP